MKLVVQGTTYLLSKTYITRLWLCTSLCTLCTSLYDQDEVYIIRQLKVELYKLFANIGIHKLLSKSSKISLMCNSPRDDLSTSIALQTRCDRNPFHNRQFQCIHTCKIKLYTLSLFMDWDKIFQSTTWTLCTLT